MNKYILLSLILNATIVFGQSYAPAAGESGSTAIKYDSSIFVDWASNIEIERGYINISDTTAIYDGSNKASFGSPSDAVGPASNISTESVSLGDSGIAVITFEYPITNRQGPDFAVFENGVTDNFLELAHVEVSSDGINYVRFPSHSETQTNDAIGSFGSLEPTHLYNLAGKYKVGYGTPFDLEELKDSAGLDVNKITHIKLIDVVGSLEKHGTTDAYGNKINDPFPTAFNSGGFDLNAVGVIHQHSLGLSIEKLDFKVYPNPSQGTINIDLLKTKVKEVTITNSLGKTVQQISSFDLNKNLQIQLSKGVYFIHVKSADQMSSKRVVIQ